MTVFEIIWEYKQAFAQGLLVTLELSCVVWLSGVVLGTVVGSLAVKFQRSIGQLFQVLSFLLSAIPVLVFLFWFHYPLQVLLDTVIDPFISASVVISTINVFAVAHLVRSSLSDFPTQYEVAAMVCGLNSRETFWRIKLPLVTRQLLPALLPIQITMLHTTLFASLISVEEIFRVSQRVNSLVYKPVEIYTSLALFFVAICLPIIVLANWLEIRFTRNISEA